MSGWMKCFELQAGQPTGRWQWVIDGAEDAYYYPGRWLDPESFTPPLPIPPVLAETAPDTSRNVTGTRNAT